MASRDDRLTTERILLLTKIPRYSDCGKLQKVVLLHGIIRMFFCDISIRKTFPRIFRKKQWQERLVRIDCGETATHL